LPFPGVADGGARSSQGSTSSAFATFDSQSMVGLIVDRLLHRSELIAIEGSSYRLKEATERAATKAKTRSAKRKA
jgi:hypothetical protein